ncbi:MAG: hypothetical protein HY064_00485 [Bacteroidetes bacterium]|nr:hypothetical protein [Bacteroidota bacterium]
MEEKTGKKIFTFLALAAGCALLYFLLLRFHLESSSPLPSLLLLLFPVALINFWLPVNARMYFLCAASCAGAYFILDFSNATALILLLFLFSAFVSSSASPGIKITLSLIFIAGLCVLRIGIIRTPLVPFIIPVAGSFLMFRLLVMLYEMKFTKPENSFVKNFAYLFLLPNLAFPLFPIIDYKTFIRSNTNNEIVIRKGMSRMLLGVIQLLIYRYVHNVVTPPLSVVHNADLALLYVLSSYLAILHMLGMMWIAVGYLGILGFDLPPIFNNVFLVNSPADIWRRINIYWREYVMKLFYYPVYFRLRKKIKKPVLISSLVVFLITGILHGWQWFWLQGTVKIQNTGIIYWTVLGIFISIGLAVQDRKNSAAHKKINPLVNVLRITGMYLFMSLLWSLWNSATLPDWLYLLQQFGHAGNGKIILPVALIILAGIVISYVNTKFPLVSEKLFSPMEKWPVTLIAAGILLAITFKSPPRYPFYIPGINFAEDIRRDQMNLDERENATENYYDKMLASDGSGRRPWEMTLEAPTPKSGFESSCSRRHDMLMREIIPNHITDLGTWKITSNRWGMRDKDYSPEKPANTYRIAILGASYEMGSGVRQKNVFETVLEKMLNDSFQTMNYEVLNFAVGGYHPPQQVWVMENKVKQFSPDLILYFVHPEDRSRNDDYMANLVHSGYDLIYPELNEVRNKAGARQSMGSAELKNRFEPFDDEISEWSLKEISSDAKKMNARLLVVYLPSMLSDEESESDFYMKFATDPAQWGAPPRYSFMSLHGIFSDDLQRWKLVDDPTHPNAAAHQLIAEKLFSELYPIFRVNEIH